MDLKTEAANAILNSLGNYLSKQLVTELQLSFAIRPSITVCCTVDYIIRNYHSSEENEELVGKLLEKFLSIYFSPTSIEL